MQNWRERISINPEIRFGKPCVINTRITVQDILSWLAGGMTMEQIMEDYPELERNDILAALAFAAYREEATKMLASA